MNSIYRKLSLRDAAVIDISSFYDDEPTDNVYISRIHVPQGWRNRGIGSQMMHDLVTQADQEKATLLAHPTTNYGSDIWRLRNFFVKFGFRHVGEGLYKRDPIRAFANEEESE